MTDQFESLDSVPQRERLPLLQAVGMWTVYYMHLLHRWLAFIGETVVEFGRLIRQPQRFRVKYFLNVIETTGYRALPIIGFLSLLIGIVLTYQTGINLKLYGANIYIVPIIGTSVLREFGPLITAIIMVGRTGSSFTAQIGTMKVNEEIDALRTMGLSPIELLVMPRILGLLVVMPLLTVWSDIFGVLGGMLMAQSVLDINYISFLQRFPENVSLTSFNIGLSKTPAFALIIAIVGCFHGFRVTGSAESVGWQTTKSVVLAIFLIIFADATFSIIYSWWNI